MPPAVSAGCGVEEFLDWLVLERGRAPRTCEAYRRDLTGYCEVLDTRGSSPEAAGEDDILAFLWHLQAGGWPLQRSSEQ